MDRGEVDHGGELILANSSGPDLSDASHHAGLDARELLLEVAIGSPDSSQNVFQSSSTQFRFAGRSRSIVTPDRALMTVSRCWLSAKFFWYPFETR